LNIQDSQVLVARVRPSGDDSRHGLRLGIFAIPCTARLTLADGQHRAAAITQALSGNACALGDETIPVVIYTDISLARSQQAFADVNRHAVHPAPSITILYDQRDENGSALILRASAASAARS
jgi:DNA sulfur modification protein DndB